MSGLRLTVYNYIYMYVSCLDVVQVKLSAIKSIVNKLPCPKCHGGFLKVPVAMLQTYSMLALMTSIHDTYFMHTCVCMLCFNYGLCNICFLINDTIRIVYRINVSTIRIVSYHRYDTQD